MKFLFIVLFLLVSFGRSFPQALPIFLDGRFDDWDSTAPGYIDTQNDGGQYDFKYFYAANDSNFLYLRLKATPEFNLIDNNQLSLYIDGDNNASTGTPINGIGAELRFNFGNRNGTFYKNGTFSIGWADIVFRELPTVTDTECEIAIERHCKPNGVDYLFTSDTIKIQFKDNSSGGDLMPNAGDTFTYVFDNTPVTPMVPIEIQREDTSALRVMSWNVLQDGLLDPSRAPSFSRILNAIQPDIICFNEFFNSSAQQVLDAINQMLPLPQGESWTALKIDPGNVTVTRYPILQSWVVYPGHRISAVLIDLPERFGTDFMVINSHFMCCTADNARQHEADATIAFLLDAETPGGIIDLPVNTPFAIMGDLNLVGYRQQLTTLVTGDIINVGEFGQGGPPDWDGTDLVDQFSSQSDWRMAYSWRDDGNSYPPGRLDFFICSDSVMNIEKTFFIQTEVMSPARLAEYGFNYDDSRIASDHLPKVTDVTFNSAVTHVQNNNVLQSFKLYQNYPNPFNPTTTIKYAIPVVDANFASTTLVSLKLFDVLGRQVATLVNEVKPAGEYEVEFNASNLPSGIYFYKFQAGSFTSTKKMILLK